MTKPLYPRSAPSELRGLRRDIDMLKRRPVPAAATGGTISYTDLAGTLSIKVDGSTTADPTVSTSEGYRLDGASVDGASGDPPIVSAFVSFRVETSDLGDGTGDAWQLQDSFSGYWHGVHSGAGRIIAFDSSDDPINSYPLHFYTHSDARQICFATIGVDPDPSLMSSGFPYAYVRADFPHDDSAAYLWFEGSFYGYYSAAAF